MPQVSATTVSPAPLLAVEGPDPGSRFFRQQLTIALRVNLYAVLPISILLSLLSEELAWAGFYRYLLLVFVLTNCNFLLLNVFYHRIWLNARTRGFKAYIELGLLLLPAVGAFGTFCGTLLLNLIAPGLLNMRVERTIGAGVLLTVAYGLAIFKLEDTRRAGSESQRELVEVRGREKQILKARDEAEVLALLALIKPHFIFNTLNAIASLIPEDPPKAEEMTLRLAQLLRSILEVKNGASLGSEIKILQAYLEIEKVRYGERLQYRLEIPQELETVSMPGLILQPLVENAINHGIRQRAEGGYVHLSARAVGVNCRVRIIDNGPGFSDHQGAGKAMKLLSERLAKLYGDRCSLTLQRDEKGGETVVELSFPRVPLQPL